MNTHNLIQNFHKAIRWNAIAYATYKIIGTAQTFLLYTKLAQDNFIAWAIVNSMIYFTLLLADCGFKKSIPHYYVKNMLQNKILKNIIAFKAMLLTIASPCCIYILTHNQLIKKSSYKPMLLLFVPLLLITQGLISLLQLIYHTKFKNKQFNLIYITTLFSQLCVNTIIIFYANSDSTIITTLITTKIIAGIFIILTTGIGLIREQNKRAGSIQHAQISKEFIKHSAIMWITGLLKSLSERNFLIPFIAYIGGPATAAIYKVANDGALLFQRTVIKTIGANDTALFTHAEHNENRKTTWQIIFTKLTSQVAGLCLPLLGIIVFVFLSKHQNKNDIFVFNIFSILIISHLFELLLLPYERVLEVKKKYLDLALAYTPYVITLLFLFVYLYTMSWIGIIPFLFLLHGVRLVSLLIMLSKVRSKFNLLYPLRYTLFLFGIYMCIGLTLYTLYIHLPYKLY